MNEQQNEAREKGRTLTDEELDAREYERWIDSCFGFYGEIICMEDYIVLNAFKGKVDNQTASSYMMNMSSMMSAEDEPLTYTDKAIMREIAMKQAEEFVNNYIDDEETRATYLGLMEKRKNDSILRDKG